MLEEEYDEDDYSGKDQEEYWCTEFDEDDYARILDLNQFSDEELMMYLWSNIVDYERDDNAFPLRIPKHVLEKWGKIVSILHEYDISSQVRLPAAVYHLNNSHVREIEKEFTFLYQIIKENQSAILLNIRKEYEDLVRKNRKFVS